MRILEKLPVVSFIIPTLNSEETLDRCLQSIANQDYPYVEIIVVDGGSKDSTVDIASRYTSKILFESGPLGKARQVGVDNSHGEILGIFDSDIILPSNYWLRNAVELFLKDPKVGIVWFVNKAPHNASCVTKCYFNLWNTFLKERLRSNKAIIPGGNILVLRKALAEAGGFSHRLRFGEDFDLTYRIVRLGYKVMIAKDVIFHDSMRSLKEFTRKQLSGALTIIRAQTEGITNFDLLHACMTWEAREKSYSNQAAIIKEALKDHILIGFKGMLSLAEDKSWLLYPILISIRIIAYASILFLSRFAHIYAKLKRITHKIKIFARM